MKVNDKVEHLLKTQPRLRNSDKELLLAFWEDQGLYFSETQKKAIYACTPAETITRARRKLRSQYPGDKKVEDKRFDKFKEFRDEYGDQQRFF